MAATATISLTLLSILLFPQLSAAAADGGGGRKPSQAVLNLRDKSPTQTLKIIQETCKASRDATTCEKWLSASNHVPRNATVLQVIYSALRATVQDLQRGGAMAKAILNSSAGNVNRTRAANNCLDLVRYADHRVGLAGGAVERRIKDARAWLSAALVYQYDCWSALKYVNDTAEVVRAMDFFNTTLIAGSSAALGMLVNYDIYGDKTQSWGPPRTERDGFWERTVPPGSQPLPGGVPPGLKEDVTVCIAGKECTFKTVQAAVNAAPNNTGSGKLFVIRIRAGVYNETVRVPLEKTNVVFLGDGMGKTVISGSRYSGQPGITTYESATVGVLGDRFMASGITFQNTAGPPTRQAVAFRSDSDRSVVENCEFLGNQDTLYAHSLRQLYKSCRIQGNVDFIFGNAAAIFHDCVILIAPRQVDPEKSQKNAVTAHGRTDPAQSTGFVFLHSTINGTDAYNSLYRKDPKAHLNYLGRPWKAFSRTVLIGCRLEDLIAADGWMPWDGDFALKTLYYGEFNNSGAGSATVKRVPWSSRIPAEHAGYYSVQNFIQRDQWVAK